MILTTNFDRLMEKALDEIDVSYDVVYSEYSLNGAVAYVHSNCMIVKINGDYKDIRTKNTIEELKNYEDKIIKYLKRILDDFGLIICGWSGDWDIALRNAIVSAPNRRYSTFWLKKGELSEMAKEIIRNRNAEVIDIEGADEFFARLLERAKSLEELSSHNVIDTQTAIQTTKRYLSKPEYRIKLHDLILEEVERVYQIFLSERFGLNCKEATKKLVDDRVNDYERVMEKILKLLSTIAYFDTGENAYLIKNAMERFSSVPIPNSFNERLVLLTKYPAFLILYTSGLAALLAEKYSTLRIIFQEPSSFNKYSRILYPLLIDLQAYKIFSERSYMPEYTNEHRLYVPLSTHMEKLCKEFLPKPLSDNDYEIIFDKFEYIYSLAYCWLNNDFPVHSSAPVCLFRFRYYLEEFQDSPVSKFIIEHINRGNNSNLIRSGLFNGDPQLLNQIKEKYDSWLVEQTKGWW